jgi:hypothetical protein
LELTVPADLSWSREEDMIVSVFKVLWVVRKSNTGRGECDVTAREAVGQKFWGYMEGRMLRG